MKFFFVHCSYKSLPSFQIRPEQAARSKHIYSTDVIFFCSQSTTSILQPFLIYLLFAIIYQNILVSDCFLDLAHYSTKRVTFISWVEEHPCFKEPENQSIQAGLPEPPACSDFSHSFLVLSLSPTTSYLQIHLLKHRTDKAAYTAEANSIFHSSKYSRKLSPCQL